MKLKPWRIVILLLAVMATPVPDIRATAQICDCFYYPDHLTAFREAKAVFIGEVIKVDRKAEIPEDVTHVHQLITFKVVKSWKGPKRTVKAWETGSHLMCARWKFEEGERYLIYANPQQGVLEVEGVCSRTRRIETDDADAIREFQELNSAEFIRKARR